MTEPKHSINSLSKELELAATHFPEITTETLRMVKAQQQPNEIMTLKLPIRELFKSQEMRRFIIHINPNFTMHGNVFPIHSLDRMVLVALFGIVLGHLQNFGRYNGLQRLLAYYKRGVGIIAIVNVDWNAPKHGLPRSLTPYLDALKYFLEQENTIISKKTAAGFRPDRTYLISQ